MIPITTLTHVPHCNCTHRYRLTINRDFEGVLSGINTQHGSNWFFDPIKEVLRCLHAHPHAFKSSAMSFELWDDTVLVAGEVGLVTGANYTSLSGFYTKDGTGTIQICAMARVLEAHGFELLDFGQHLE